MLKILHVNRYGILLGGKEITVARTMEATKKECDHHLAYHLPETANMFPCECHEIHDPSSLRKNPYKGNLLDVAEFYEPDVIHLHDHILNPFLLKKLAVKYPLVRSLHDASIFCPVGTYTRGSDPAECPHPLGPACFQKCLKWHSPRQHLLYRRFTAARRILSERALFTASWDFLVSLLKINGIPHERITRAPCWMPEFSHHAGEGNLVGAVLRLHRAKGLADLIALLEGIPTVRLLLVGDGPDREHFADQLEEKNLLSRVEFTGWLEGEELESAYRRARVVILPTQTSEGLPLSLQQAAANGKPLVGYDLGGVRDVVENNVNGFLIPRGDAISFVQAVKSLLEDPALHRAMGERSLALAQSRYRRTDHREAYLRTYNRALYFHKTGRV